MKVFISSIIGGFGPYREACKRAVSTLRHEPVMAEDFGARPHSPQIACLQGLRQSDVVVLVLGEHYGTPQASGLSATHEEYREAKGRKAVLAFVQSGVSPDPAQADFITEMQAWEGGLFRGSFSTPDDLRDGITGALHDYDLARQAAPVDQKALTESAIALLPEDDRNSSHEPLISIAIAAAPSQSVLRPAEIEQPALAEAMHQNALFGSARVFDGKQGVRKGMNDDVLELTQENGGLIQLNETGSMLLRLPLREADRNRRDHGFPAIIEETVLARLHAALDYAAWLLEHIDPTQRLTHLSIAARISASDHMSWRTQREQDASPSSGTMGGGRGRDERKHAHVSKPRAALRLDRQRLAEDLLVPLRRQWKAR
jgi:hypothetical protein